MNKMDHSIPPSERRHKSNIQQIGRRWKGSRAQSQDANAQKNHDFAWMLHRVAIVAIFSQVFAYRGNFYLKYSLFPNFTCLF